MSLNSGRNISNCSMDPDKPIDIAVIKTLIYGNSASALLSEEGMRQLAGLVREEDPENMNAALRL